MGNQIIQFANASSGGTGNIIVTTAIDLINLQNTNSLVPNQVYQFPYQMVWKLEGTIGTIYKTNGNDIFQIRATSVNTFSPIVSSLLFPSLLINFTFTIPFGWTPPQWFGYVENIIDPTQNTYNIGGDYRFLQWRRWNNGSGAFIVTSDNGNGFIDRPVFNGIMGIDISIDNLLTGLKNTIILQQTENIVIKSTQITNSNFTKIIDCQIFAFVLDNCPDMAFFQSTINKASFTNVNVFGLVQSNLRGVIGTNNNSLNISACEVISSNYTNCNNLSLENSFINRNDCLALSVLNIKDCNVIQTSLISCPTANLKYTNTYKYALSNDSINCADDANLDARAVIEANNVSISAKIDLNFLASGQNITGIIIPKGMRVKSTFLKNVSGAGAGTFNIGTTTQLQSISPITAFPFSTFTFDNLVFDTLANSENLVITKTGVSTGIFFIYITLTNTIS